MPETLVILVGDNFTIECGGIGQIPCNESDYQEIIEYIVEELHLDPRYSFPDVDGTMYSLLDVLKTLLLRIEALEE